MLQFINVAFNNATYLQNYWFATALNMKLKISRVRSLTGFYFKVVKVSMNDVLSFNTSTRFLTSYNFRIHYYTAYQQVSEISTNKLLGLANPENLC